MPCKGHCENNEVAVCFFNKTNKATEVGCTLNEVKNVVSVTLTENSSYICKELWDKTEMVVTDKLSATVEPHGVKVFRISANS